MPLPRSPPPTTVRAVHRREIFDANPPPAAADTVHNLGYWNNTSGDLVIGVAAATENGDTLRIRSTERGISTYARR